MRGVRELEHITKTAIRRGSGHRITSLEQPSLSITHHRNRYERGHGAGIHHRNSYERGQEAGTHHRNSYERGQGARTHR